MVTGNWLVQHGQGDWRGGSVAVMDLELGKLSWRSLVSEEDYSYRGVAFVPDAPQLVLTRRDTP